MDALDAPCPTPLLLSWSFSGSLSKSGDMYQKVGLIGELIDKPPPAMAKIVYAGNNVLDTNTGKENTPTQVNNLYYIQSV